LNLERDLNHECRMRKNYIFYGLFLIIFAVGFNPASAQNGMEGKEFWLGFIRSYDEGSNLVIYIYSRHATSGAVTIPSINYNHAFTLAAGGLDSVFLPSNLAISSATGKGNKAIYIWADDSISVTAANYRYALYDATYILPKQHLRADYYALAYSSIIHMPSELLAVALFDNTTIEFTPSVNTLNGIAKGQSLSII
jgi:hypothetical protein